MASPAIHLAIAKKYMENNHFNDKVFIKGALYPDAQSNSVKLHYPKSDEIGEFAIGVYDKVDLYSFLVETSKT